MLDEPLGRVLKIPTIIAAAFILGLLLPAAALLVNVFVNSWDDAPGAGFIVLAVPVIGAGVGLIAGLSASFAPTLGIGLVNAFRSTLIAALVMGGVLSAWIHGPEHAVRAYVATVVFVGLAWILKRASVWAN